MNPKRGILYKTDAQAIGINLKQQKIKAKMKPMLFISLILLTISCSYRKPEKIHTVQSNGTFAKDSLTPEKPALKTSRNQHINIGYDENYQKLPKLIFETADEAEFLALEQKRYIETFKPEEKGNFFYIQSRLKKHKFKKYDDYGGKLSWSGFEFSGYYPATKLYAITEHSTSENLNFSQLFLLDSLNGYHYNIISFGDASVSLPVPSINNKYFVYFYNAVYDH